MDVTKPYKFIGFGVMDVTKPYKFIGFGAMDGPKPYKFIRFRATNPGRRPLSPPPGGCRAPKHPLNSGGPPAPLIPLLGGAAAPEPYKFIGFGAMDVTKSYKFIGFGAMDVTKSCKFIGFGAVDVTKPYKFIGFGAVDVTKPYKFRGSGGGPRPPDLPPENHYKIWAQGQLR
jgi:hypothetical protein